MMKRKMILLGLIILAVALPAIAQAIEFKLPPIRKQSLPNGLDVYVIEQHEVPVVSMRLVIPGGTSDDTEDKAGLANLTCTLLRKGTTTRSATQVSQEIDFVGGSLGAGADQDAFYVTCTVLSKHLDKGLDLLSDITLHPAFADEEVEREKQQLISAIMLGKSDPGTIRNQQFEKYLFGPHPYGLPAIGTQESMVMLSSADVKEFYQKYFLPNDAFIIIVGDVKADEMIKKISDYLGKWPMGTVAQIKMPEIPKIEGYKIILVDKPDATQSYVALGHPGISLYNPDAFVARAVNYILGGGAFSSRLMKEVRSNKGLTYDISSQFDLYRYPGAFTINTFTKNESTGEAIRMIIEEMKKMCDALVTEKELADTKSFYSGYLPLQFETGDNIATRLQMIFMYNLGEDYYNRYIQSINQATLADLQAVAKKYLDPNNLLIVVVGKAADVKPQLEQLGKVTVIPLIEL